MLRPFKLLSLLILLIVFTSCENDSNIKKQKYYEGEQVPGTETFYPLDLFGYTSRKIDVSPNGNYIVYRTYDGAKIQKMNLETGEKKDVFEYGFFPDWSPNGKWIAFKSGNQIVKIRPDGTDFTQLTKEGFNSSPDWSPDGNYILYDNKNCGSGGQPPPENSCGILKMTKDGRNNQLIVPYFGNPLWKNSHEFIAGAYLYDTSGVKLDSFNFEIGFSNADVSPNGKRIVMGTSKGIYYMNSDGSGYKRILPDHRNNHEPIELLADAPTWCPDNEHIIYEHFRITKYVKKWEGIYLEGYISFYKVNVDSALAVSNLDL